MPVILVATNATSGDAGWQDSSTVGGSERVDYVSTLLVGQGQPAPFDTSRFEMNAIGTGDIEAYRQYASYARCSAEIYVYNDSEQLVATYTGLQFSDTAAIVAWVNTNVTTSGGSFNQSARIQLYDTVDSALPTIRKVRGVNGLNQRYKDATSISRFAAHIGGNREQQLLADMWSSSFLAAFPTAVGTWGVNDFACFWRRTGKQGTQYRAQWDSISGWVAPSGKLMVKAGSVQSASGLSFSYDGSSNVVFAALRPNGTSFDVLPIVSKNFREMARHQANGWSVLVGIPVIEGGGGQALWIKPMGQDTFYTSWFDTTSYRLECVGGWDRDKGNRLRVMAPDGVGWPAGDLMGPFNSLPIMEASLASTGNETDNLGGKEKPGDVRFQLRDLATNKVSPLSDWRIHWRGRERYMQYQGFAQYSKR